MTTSETLKGGATVHTLVIGRNCSHVELKSMLYLGRTLVDGLGERQYAMTGDGPIRLKVGPKTVAAFVCCEDRGTTATLARYVRSGTVAEEIAPPEKAHLPAVPLRDRLFSKTPPLKALVLAPDCTAAEVIDVRQVGPFLYHHDTGALYRVSDDTSPMTLKIGRKSFDLYVVSAATGRTANLFLHGDSSVMSPEEIPPNRIVNGGFYAGSLFALRTSPDLASQVWDGNMIKYGWQITENKRMIAIAFVVGAVSMLLLLLLISMML